MTWYLGIDPLQEPFDLGPDDNQRARVVFNILAHKQPSDTFLQEIAQRLQASGVGTRGTNIFIGSSIALPEVSTAVLSILPTGGSGPDRIMNEPGSGYERPAAQIVTRALEWDDAWTMASAAKNALVTVSNMQLSDGTVNALLLVNGTDPLLLVDGSTSLELVG